MNDGGEIVLERAGGIARLVPLEEEHAEALFPLIADEETWRFLVVRRPLTAAEMRGWTMEAAVARQRGAEIPFAVVDRRDGRIAGTTRFMDMNPLHRQLEIGATAYGRQWRRTPMNTECKLLMLAHAFETMGIERVQLKCDSRNEASRRAIARLGATFEGILRRHRVLEDGYVRDTAIFSIIRREWPDVRQRLETMLAG